MARQAHLLKFVSAERIQSELRKMIIGPNVGSILMNHKTPLLQILPEFTPCIGFEQHSVWHCWDVYTHIVQAVETSPEDELVRLALLFHDIGKPHCFTMDESGAGHFHGHGKISAEVTDEILKRLRFDNDTRERVVKLVFNHDVRLEANLPTVRRWVRKIGREDFACFLQIRKADILAQSEYERR